MDYSHHILDWIESSDVSMSFRAVASDNIDEMYSCDGPDRVWFFTQSSLSPRNRPLFERAYETSDLFEVDPKDLNGTRYIVSLSDRTNEVALRF
ncbi:hypothetical protein P0G11_12995, partial [Adlercreutzia rubneri]|uniref:hypothetical protein n=1 Tax=Adlercreutzia rubneri TaxID=2916441 RepID=UPI0023AE9D36